MKCKTLRCELKRRKAKKNKAPLCCLETRKTKAQLARGLLLEELEREGIFY